MKDKKSILLIIVSFLLFIVSFTLLWTWGYRFYNKQPGEEAKAGVVASPAPHSMRDSLQMLYAATEKELDDRLIRVSSNTDSLKDVLNKKLAEFYRLRTEIAALLNDKAPLPQQPSSSKKDPENFIQKTSFDNVTPDKTSAPLTISDVSLAAVTTENDREQETTQAQRTEKLVGSFLVKNNADQNNVSEVMVIVLQPDGQVVKNSAWESGTFQTNEGKKVYSYKLRFDNNREPRRLLFSLTTEKYLKGSYTMQVYFNGVLLAKTIKTLT